MTMAAYDSLVEDFEFLDDWEERYRHVIELGKALPDLEDAQRNDATKVDGCVSRVWIDSRAVDGPNGKIIEFDGDSDAHIVKGLIAILRTMLSGQRAEDILRIDIQDQLQRIDLSSHLSPQRSNGLSAMIQRVKGFAATQVNEKS